MTPGPLGESRAERTAERGIQQCTTEGERQPGEDNGEGEKDDRSDAAASDESSAPISLSQGVARTMRFLDRWPVSIDS
jgi:hypothetical protein